MSSNNRREDLDKYKGTELYVYSLLYGARPKSLSVRELSLNQPYDESEVRNALEAMLAKQVILRKDINGQFVYYTDAATHERYKQAYNSDGSEFGDRR